MKVTLYNAEANKSIKLTSDDGSFGFWIGLIGSRREPYISTFRDTDGKVNQRGEHPTDPQLIDLCERFAAIAQGDSSG
ncbi:MAG: hypothetical protein RLO51_11110 [Thalassobaculum sp.]|uniref:hypothetical protein n=1 Tax=Thalassobaculum sp. TaxID=2022740 RepID=UPI0032EE6C05